MSKEGEKANIVGARRVEPYASGMAKPRPVGESHPFRQFRSGLVRVADRVF